MFFTGVVAECTFAFLRGASAIVKRAGHKGRVPGSEGSEYVVKCFVLVEAEKRRMLREEVRVVSEHCTLPVLFSRAQLLIVPPSPS